LSRFREKAEEYRLRIEAELENSLRLIADSPLRESIGYVFSMGGKRVRPLLTVFAAEAVGKSSDDVLHAAAAIEILHNFTLVHDDIMDNAGTRRGKTTVHVASGVNTAILVGDQMMALAYDCLEKCSGEHLREALRIFNEGVKQVCDGQALDESLSKLNGSSMQKYIDMISKKTGALLMAAGQLGSLLGGGTPEDVRLLGDFGLNIGIAFQILDDMLDLEGDAERFGKPRGLDIMEKKKNYMFLKAQQSLGGREISVVNDAYRKASVNEDDVVAVRDIYRRGGVLDAAKEEVAEYTHEALSSLDVLKDSEGKDALVELANSLVQRKF
jgi:geranylgeranyl diphosphate synthase, type II